MDTCIGACAIVTSETVSTSSRSVCPVLSFPTIEGWKVNGGNHPGVTQSVGKVVEYKFRLSSSHSIRLVLSSGYSTISPSSLYFAPLVSGQSDVRTDPIDAATTF
jgi:hypothetical protein